MPTQLWSVSASGAFSVSIHEGSKRALLVPANTNTIYVVELDSGNIINSGGLSFDASAGALIKDGSEFIVGGANGELEKFAVSDFTSLASGSTDPTPRDACYSEVDDVIALGDSDNEEVNAYNTDLSLAWSDSSNVNNVSLDRENNRIVYNTGATINVVDPKDGSGIRSESTDIRVAYGASGGGSGYYGAVYNGVLQAFGPDGTETTSGNDIGNVSTDDMAFDPERELFVAGGDDPADSREWYVINPDGTLKSTISASRTNDIATTTALKKVVGVAADFEAGEFQAVEFDEFVGEKVSGTVTDTNGNALDSATVEVVETSSSDTGDANGNYAVYEGDGTYTLRASKSDYFTEEKEVTVSGGPETVDFTLESEVDISVDTSDAAAGDATEAVPVSIEEESRSAASGNTDAQGAATVKFGASITDATLKVADGDRRYETVTRSLSPSDDGSTQTVSLTRRENIGTLG